MNTAAKINQPSPTLLVVDDDPALRFAMTSPLKQAGYTVGLHPRLSEPGSLARNKPSLV